jgi:hypothetical protein
MDQVGHGGGALGTGRYQLALGAVVEHKLQD